jgi:hypothetical protein
VDQEQGSGAWSRWSRACLLATVTVAAATLAHAAGGAELPPAWALLTLLAAMVPALAMVLGRPLTRGGAAAVVGGGQLVLHGLLTVVGGSTAHPSSGTAAVSIHHGHGHMSGPVSADSGLLGTLLSHLQEPSAASVSMFAGHVVAAAAVGVWIASGEQALWWCLALMASNPTPLRLAATVAATLRGLATRVQTQALSRCVVQWPEHTKLVGQLLTSCGVVRRGPPAGACA